MLQLAPLLRPVHHVVLAAALLEVKYQTRHHADPILTEDCCTHIIFEISLGDLCLSLSQQGYTAL